MYDIANRDKDMEDHCDGYGENAVVRLVSPSVLRP